MCLLYVPYVTQYDTPPTDCFSKLGSVEISALDETDLSNDGLFETEGLLAVE